MDKERERENNGLKQRDKEKEGKEEWKMR